MIACVVIQSRSYHWTILMTAGFFISACGSIVAFSGSFVDGLVSGAVGLILNGVIIGLLSRHKVMSNIFELTAAGVIAFIAVSLQNWCEILNSFADFLSSMLLQRGLGATGYFCYSSIVSVSENFCRQSHHPNFRPPLIPGCHHHYSPRMGHLPRRSRTRFA